MKPTRTDALWMLPIVSIIIAGIAVGAWVYANQSVDPLAGVPAARILHTEPLPARDALYVGRALLTDGPAGRVFLVYRCEGVCTGMVTRLDDRTGRILASRPMGDVTPLLDPHTGRVFDYDAPGGSDGQTPRFLSMLDGSTGNALSTTSLGAGKVGNRYCQWPVDSVNVGCDLAEDQRRGHVFLAYPAPGPDGPPVVSMFDARTGRLLHTSQLQRGCRRYDCGIVEGIAVAEHSDRVFVVVSYIAGGNSTAVPVHMSETDVVYVFSATSGSVIRSVDIGDNGSDWQIQVDEATGTVLLLGDQLFIFDAATGQQLRNVQFPTAADNLIVDAGSDHAFVVLPGSSPFPYSGPTYTGRLEMLSVHTGAVLQTWALDTTRTNTASLDAPLHRLYITTESSLMVIDTRAGTLLGRLRWDRDVVDIQFDHQGRHVYLLAKEPDSFCGANDQFVELDAATGRVLQAVPAACADSMTVVERTHRIFVTADPGLLVIQDVK